MPYMPKISNEQANYLKALMQHISDLLDNERDDVLTIEANTVLEGGMGTRFSIEVETAGYHVMPVVEKK